MALKWIVLVLLMIVRWVAVRGLNLHPILFFPGYSLSRLAVTVERGSEPGCPTEGSFVVEFQMQPVQNGFTQECMMNYLALLNNEGNATHPFENRPDVKITIPGRTTGSIDCLQATQYAGMIQYLTSKGYTSNSTSATFLAACYDWRLDPSHDVLDGPSFMNNSINLVLQAYSAAGKQRVWVMGHSNGPIMGLYFLTHLTAEFKQKYIAGFISLSGNFAGQGLMPSVFVEGLSVIDFNFFLPTAKVMMGWPSNYISSPQPAVFNGPNSLYFFQTNTPAKEFYVTEEDYDSFFRMANNPFGLSKWRSYIGLVGPHTPPDVYTFSIWGNNISTLYGLHVESFTDVTILQSLTRNGDINQEDIDNESCKVWNTTMAAGCFDYWVVDNVNHFELSNNPQVLDKIYALVSNPPPPVLCSSSF